MLSTYIEWTKTGWSKMHRVHVVVLAGAKVGGIAKNSTFSLFWSMSSKSSSPCDKTVECMQFISSSFGCLNMHIEGFLNYRNFWKKQLLGGTFFDLLFFPIFDFGVVPPVNRTDVSHSEFSQNAAEFGCSKLVIDLNRFISIHLMILYSYIRINSTNGVV